MTMIRNILSIDLLYSIEYEIEVYELSKRSKVPVLTTRSFSMKDIQNIVDLIRTGYVEDEVKLYYPRGEENISMINFYKEE